MPMENANFIIENLKGTHEVKEIKKELDRIHGVTSVSVNPAHNLVCVDYESSAASYDQIENRLNTLGFGIAADASDISDR